MMAPNPTKSPTRRPNCAGGNTVARRPPLDRSELETVLGFRVREAWGVMERQFAERFREEKITPAVYAILALVAANPDCLASEICAATSINSANIIPYMDELIDRGLIRREVGASDRRLKHLRITYRGIARLVAWRQIEARQMRDFQKMMGPQNVRKLMDLLIQLVATSYEDEP